MIYVDRILHWQIAKIVSVNDLMQWNIVVKITNSLWKTEYPLVIEKKYSIFRSLQDMIFEDHWYFWILHWEIAKIVSLNDLMQWNIVVKITNRIPSCYWKGKQKKKKKYSIFRSLQDMIFKDHWYFWILHWEIAKWNDEHHNRTKY